MIQSPDRVWFGTLIGLIGPPIAFLLFCYFSLPDESVLEVIRRYHKLNVLTHVISLSVIVNLALFFLFLQKRKEKISRGILGSMFFFVLIVLILKFL